MTADTVAHDTAVHHARRVSQGQPLLVVRDLKKHFPISHNWLTGERKAVHAVDGVSFSVQPGRTLGIVGESGCGKSTTARLVARLVQPDAGELIFDGEGVDEFRGLQLKAFRRELQMVFQDSFASLNPRLTITETVAYGPQVHGVPAAQAEQEARELLARVGLEPALFGNRYPHELSGGQRQRVNIARALAYKPRMVILDEAVAALDKSVQAQVLNLLQELKAERGLTYLFISHDLHVVHYLSDEVMVMYLGQVVEQGPVERVYGHPAHPYTRALLSAVPSMDPDRRTQAPSLGGDPPNPISPPAGCRFRDRCPQADAVCATQTPALRAVIGPTWHGSPHVAACHLNDIGSGHPQALGARTPVTLETPA